MTATLRSVGVLNRPAWRIVDRRICQQSAIDMICSHAVDCRAASVVAPDVVVLVVAEGLAPGAIWARV